ncbi:MAG: tetratricopeptide repeat protein [Chitinivibrionia bacterium]|nr:tetratricopeptide repeat protein [Chitinivibrionia bacterium]
MKKAVFFILLSFCLVLAGRKEFIREYTYQASEMDSKVSARTNASVEIRNILLREIGQFVFSQQVLIDDEFFERALAVTAGVVEMTIINESWNGREYRMKARMVVDTRDVERRINAIMQDFRRSEEMRLARERLMEFRAQAMNMRNNQMPFGSYQEIMTALASEDDFTFGVVAYENGQFREALNHLNKALRRNRTPANVHYMLGKTYLGLNNQRQADRHFKRAADMGHPGAQFRQRTQGYRR